MAGVIRDGSGNLYGTTEDGGVNGNDWGTVFKLTPGLPGVTVSANPTSLTIMAGQSGTVTLTVTPENGFGSTVSFACSGLPAEASCNFSPQTVTPSGGNAATTMLTVTTTAPSSAVLRRVELGPRVAYALLLPVLALVLLGVARGQRPLGLPVVLGFALALASCGGGTGGASSGSGGGGGGNAGTPSGTSTITVTAGVAGGATQTAILTVTVTQ